MKLMLDFNPFIFTKLVKFLLITVARDGGCSHLNASTILGDKGA